MNLLSVTKYGKALMPFRLLFTLLLVFQFLYVFLQMGQLKKTPNTADFEQFVHPQIAILTFNTNSDILEPVLIRNHAQYARKHGYAFHFETLNLVEETNYTDHKGKKLNAVYTKILLMREMFLKFNYKWVWLLDYDALIMNQNLTIEDHVLGSAQRISIESNKTMDDISLIYATDSRGINAGSIFLRNSKWTFDMIDYVMTLKKRIAFREQGAIKEYMTSHEEKILKVPQSLINAYPSDTAHNYKEGYFVVHFPGGLKKYMKKFIKKLKNKP